MVARQIFPVLLYKRFIILSNLKLFVCDSGGTIMTAVDFQNKNRFQVVRYRIYFWDGVREKIIKK